MKKIIGLILAMCLSLSSMPIMADSGWDGSYDNSYIYVANRYVNVRAEPHTSSKIMGALTKNCIIPGLEPVHDWVPVNYNGYLGYVSAQYLTQTAKPLSQCKDYTYIANCKITGYDACRSCCGKTDGITASGTYAKAGRTAAIKGYPYGSRIYIEGVGYRINEDTGGFGYNHVDVFCNNHAECYALTGYKKVYLVK